MASTYSPNLRIELIGTGDQAGTWGNTTNSTDQYVLESAITGYQQVTVTSTSQALTYVNGSTTSASSNQAIFAFLSLATSGVSTAFNVYAPPNPKSYVIYNASSYAATIYNSTAIGNTIAAGLGVVIPAGAIITIWSDGTNFRASNTQTAGNFVINGDLTVTGSQVTTGGFYASGVLRTFTSASFTGSISGTTLTVTAVASGVLFSGMSISGTGIAAATSTNLTNPLSTTNTSATVTVTQAGHGFTTGTPVTIAGASAVGGIPAINLNGTFSITVINANSYSYTAGATATSTVTGSGGAVTVSTPQTQISGYGTGTGGNGTYTVNVPQTVSSTTITGAPGATASTPPTTDSSNNIATTQFVKNVAAQAGNFTYPGAGIPLSSGAAWGTSFTNSGNPITVAYGGTGLATLTSGSVLVGAGTSTPTLVAPGTTGNVLVSNGSTWISGTGVSLSGSNSWTGSNSFSVTPTVSGSSVLTTATGAQLSGASFTGSVSTTGAFTSTSAGGYAALQSNAIGIGTSSNTISSTGSGNVFNFNVSGSTTAALSSTQFVPVPDNTLSLGSSGLRWTTVYATTSTINTSDRNEKQQIADLTAAEKAVGQTLKGMMKTFKFNDAVQKKGADARIHFGVIAQDVQAAFEAQGLNADNYGVFCSDTLPDGTVRLGVRYEELFALIIGAL
jgi:Chaperone of endosialidase